VPQIIQRSFSAGEIAPSLRARADLTKYASGLALCENFLIRAQGGAYSRAGFRFVGEIADSSKKARLIPFSFNSEQAYVLVAEENSLQFVRAGGYIVDPADPPNAYTVTTTYTEAQLYNINFTQSADVLTLVNANHEPANLSRLADDNWSLDDINFTPVVVAPSTPSAATIGTGGGTYDKTYTYVVTAIDGDNTESIASTAVSITSSSLAQTFGIRLTWSAVTGAVRYRVYKDPSKASGVYGWIGDSNSEEFTDFNLAPLTDDAPPEDRDPFNTANDQPSTVTYYQQRQLFANTTNEPQTVYTTQTNNFSSLRTSNPSRDDDAITFTINARQVNEIRHLLSLDSLVIFTSGGEWILTEGQDEVLKPSTVGVKVQSYNGCSTVAPVVVNNTAIYIQEKGARVRDFTYTDYRKYDGTDLSLLAEHLFEGFEILSMAYSAEPYGIIWCVRSDGVLLGLTYQKEQQVWAWHQHTTDGEFESVVSISEGDSDAVYVIVKRTLTINDAPVIKRYVERLEKREDRDARQCFYVDSGLSLDNPSVVSAFAADGSGNLSLTDTAHGYDTGDLIEISAISSAELAAFNHTSYKITVVDVNTYLLVDAYTGVNIPATALLSLLTNPAEVVTAQSRVGVTTISGLAHLQNKAVAVLADGNEIQGLVVASGQITLPYPCFIVHVGLQYIPALETLDIDTPEPTQTLKAQSLSVSRLFIETERSRGIWAGPIDGSYPTQELLEFKTRSDADNYDAVSLTTAKEEIYVQPQWSKSGSVRIEQRSPLPLAVLSIIPMVDIGG
jgi:hypothetical protein